MGLHTRRGYRASGPALAGDVDEWQEQRRCTQPDVDADWWTEDKLQGRGVHECLRHCSVRGECDREQELRPQPGVYAAVLWTRTSRLLPVRVSKTQPTERGCTHDCAPRAHEPARCQHCGGGFTPEYSFQRYCDPDCYRVAENERNRARRAAKKKAAVA